MLGCSFRDAESISSQKSPVLALLFFLHDDFDAVKSVDDFGTDTDDVFEEDKVEVIDFLSVFDGEFDRDLIIAELYFEFILLFNDVGDFNAYFGWSLIPSVSELGT